MEKRQSLRRLTEHMLIEYIHKFYSGVFIEGLVQGNVLAQVRFVSARSSIHRAPDLSNNSGWRPDSGWTHIFGPLAYSVLVI